jgi:serine/threonine protein kinase/WD40 repeat protein
MSVPEPKSDPPEQPVVDRLLEYDAALDAGGPTGAADADNLPPECLEGFACLDMLERLRLGDPRETRAERTRAWQAPDPTHVESPRTSAAAETLGDVGARARLGKFEIVRMLGHGGCGMVFLARDPVLNRPLALKIPRPETLLTPEMRQRFLREGRAAGSLDHPNLVPVYEVGESDGLCYLASAYCPGPTLREWLRQQTQPVQPRSAAYLVATLAEAVDYIHGQGVLHRDLKPSNVLLMRQRPTEAFADTALEEYVPRITDFGLAKVLEVDAAAREAPTRTGAVFGTPQYMSPEQALGYTTLIGPPTDVYSLGAILYELLTGVVPIQGLTDLDTLSRVVDLEPPPLGRLRPNVHRDLETICLKCLEKAPARRYGTALELAGDLKRFLTGEPIRARPCGKTERAWRWCRRRPTQASLLAVTCVFLLTVLPGWFWYRTNLADAQARHQRMAHLAAEERRAREAAEENARTQQYFGLVNRVRERNTQKPLGWTWASLADLADAARLEIPARDLVQLRSEAATVFAGVDLREKSVLADDFSAYCLEFSPDGKSMAAGQDIANLFTLLAWAQVRLIDTATGETRATLSYPTHVAQLPNGPAPDGTVCLAFSADGKYLAAGTRSGWVHCWDLGQGSAKPVSWQATTQRVHEIAFHPHRLEVYTASHEDTAVKRWDARTGKLLAQHMATNLPRGIVVHPAGETLAVNYANTVHTLDAQSMEPGAHKVDRYAPKMDLGLMCYTAEGRFLAVETDTALLLLDAETGAEVRRFADPGSEKAHRGALQRLEFSPDGSLLFSASENEQDRSLRIWEVASGRLLVKHVFGEWGPLAFAVHPQGKLVVTAAHGRVVLHELANGEVQTFRAQQPWAVDTAGFSADGQVLACSASPRNSRDPRLCISLWHTRGGARIHNKVIQNRERPLAGQTGAIAFHPRRPLLAASGWSHDIAIFDTDGQPAACIKGSEPGLVSFDRNGTRLWAVLGQNTVRSWRWPNGEPASSWRYVSWRLHGRNQLYCLAAGRRWVLAGGRDGGVHLLNADDGKRVSSWPGPEVPVRSIAIAPDETWAAVGSQNGHVRIMSLPDGTVRATLQDHTESVDGLAIDAAGKWLITASREPRVHLYRLDCAVPERYATLTMPAGPVRGLCFHPDGKQFALIAGPETAVRVWSLSALEKRWSQVGLP